MLYQILVYARDRFFFARRRTHHWTLLAKDSAAPSVKPYCWQNQETYRQNTQNLVRLQHKFEVFLFVSLYILGTSPCKVYMHMLGMFENQEDSLCVFSFISFFLSSTVKVWSLNFVFLGFSKVAGVGHGLHWLFSTFALWIIAVLEECIPEFIIC